MLGPVQLEAQHQGRRIQLEAQEGKQGGARPAEVDRHAQFELGRDVHALAGGAHGLVDHIFEALGLHVGAHRLAEVDVAQGLQVAAHLQEVSAGRGHHVHGVFLQEAGEAQLIGQLAGLRRPGLPLLRIRQRHAHAMPQPGRLVRTVVVDDAEDDVGRDIGEQHRIVGLEAVDIVDQRVGGLHRHRLVGQERRWQRFPILLLDLAGLIAVRRHQEVAAGGAGDHRRLAQGLAGQLCNHAGLGGAGLSVAHVGLPFRRVQGSAGVRRAVDAGQVGDLARGAI